MDLFLRNEITVKSDNWKKPKGEWCQLKYGREQVREAGDSQTSESLAEGGGSVRKASYLNEGSTVLSLPPKLAFPGQTPFIYNLV